LISERGEASRTEGREQAAEEEKVGGRGLIRCGVAGELQEQGTVGKGDEGARRRGIRCEIYCKEAESENVVESNFSTRRTWKERPP
jgi:hypothetical protein